jgi:acyl phosphate:glycerol-3-phosphate acyltransferase
VGWGLAMGDILSGSGVAAIVVGYLLGSIPFGLLLTRAAGLGDVRKIGSGNIGATNVLRTGNKGLAAATLLLDALKATAAVYLVYKWVMPASGMASVALLQRADTIAAMAGVAAFIGHVFPVWLGFKGGKGVATFIGASLGFYWPAALAFCLLWLGIAALFRISSLAALSASALATVYPFLVGQPFYGLLLLLMTVLIFFKHEANIRRLIAGEEPKIGQKS